MLAGSDRAKPIHSIQWLRAAAALAVLAFHLSLHLEQTWALGAAGVDVFFVVSGFIMWTVTAREQSPAAFMMNRIVRIAPLYWTATSVMVFGALAGLFPSVVLTAGHVAGSLLFVPHVSPSNGQVWPLLVQGWTLNYEMFFYGLFALALFAPRRARLWLMSAALGALVLVGGAAKPQNVAAAFFTDALLLEFLAGMTIARAFETGLRLDRFSAALLVALALGLFAFTLLSGAWASRWIMYGAPSALLVLGMVGLERAGVSFDWRPAVFLGDASYSLYLFHSFAVSVAAKLVDFSSAPWLGLVVGAAGSVAVGIGAYLLIERPLLVALRPERRQALWAALARLWRSGAAQN